MTFPTTHTHYACHRLIDQHGTLYPASVIRVDTLTHSVLKVTLFDYTEQPFTQWVGGTILLADHRQPPLQPGHTLAEYIPQDLSPTSTLAAWHTPLTDLYSPLPAPLVRMM